MAARSDGRGGEPACESSAETDQRSTRIIPGSTMLTSLVSSARRKRVPASIHQPPGRYCLPLALRYIKKLAKQRAAASESFTDEIQEADSAWSGWQAKMAVAKSCALVSFNNVRATKNARAEAVTCERTVVTWNPWGLSPKRLLLIKNHS